MAQSLKLRFELPFGKETPVRAKGKFQYVAGLTRPCLAGPEQLMEKEVSKPKDNTFKAMEKILKYCSNSSDEGQKIVEFGCHPVH